MYVRQTYFKISDIETSTGKAVPSSSATSRQTSNDSQRTMPHCVPKFQDRNVRENREIVEMCILLHNFLIDYDETYNG